MTVLRHKEFVDGYGPGHGVYADVDTPKYSALTFGGGSRITIRQIGNEPLPPTIVRPVRFSPDTKYVVDQIIVQAPIKFDSLENLRRIISNGPDDGAQDSEVYTAAMDRMRARAGESVQAWADQLAGDLTGHTD